MRKALLFTNRNIILNTAVITAALAFVPAFLYGVVSVWGVVFGVLLALHFDGRLQGIINKCTPIENESDRSYAVVGYYALLVIEMTAIASFAPIFMLYSGWAENSVITSLDATLMNFAPAGFLAQGDYVDDPVNLKIFTSITTLILISLIFVFGYSFKKMMKIAGWVNYKKNSWDPNCEKYNPVITAHHNQWSSGGSLYALILVLLYIEICRNCASDPKNFSLALTIIGGYIVLKVALLLNFTSYVSIKK